jgi:hypothetical protein
MSTPLPLAYGEVAELPRVSLVARVALAALQLAAVGAGMGGFLVILTLAIGALHHG